MKSTDWRIFTGAHAPHDNINHLPSPPNWRRFAGAPGMGPPDEQEPSLQRRLGHVLRPYDDNVVTLINIALYLRRPLLVSGPPGSGKSTIPYAVTRELQLGPVLRWPISSRSTLQQGLYQYDPISLLRDENARERERAGDGGGAQAKNSKEEEAPQGIWNYIRLGPLGTALLPYHKPRVLLIDEFDKCDIDLPNDLLNVFEDGEYEIHELSRLSTEPNGVPVRTADQEGFAKIVGGSVRCRAFPFIVLTSNDEREFPPAFLRRCIKLDMTSPSAEEIMAMVAAHFSANTDVEAADRAIQGFLDDLGLEEIGTDQLLSLIYLTSHRNHAHDDEWRAVAESLLAALGGTESR